MGSKIKPSRNKKDSVIIRDPILPNSGGIRSRQDHISEICILSFQAKVKELPFIVKNTPVNIKKVGPYHQILVLGSVIGKLSKKQSEMVETCAFLGVTYAGIIINEQNGLYARFTRIVR